MRDVITSLKEVEEGLDKPSLSKQVREFYLSKEKKLLDEFAWWQNNKPPRLTVDRDGEAAKLDPGREGDDPKQKQQGSDLELKNGSEKREQPV